MEDVVQRRKYHFFIAVVFLCPAFLTAAVQVRTDIEFRRVSGESLKLDAHIPEGPGPFPAVILVHGGGWSAGSKQASFIKPFFPLLDESGLAWFSIDYRLAPKYPYPAAVDDVEAAIRYIKENAREFHIDANRLALTGESAGGHLVALVAARAKPETSVAAIVPFYGAFDLEALVAKSGEPSRGFQDFLGIRDLSEPSRRLLREASAATYVKPGLPPFLLIHGTADQAVPYEQSTHFCEQLKAAGNVCELYTVENGIHGVINWEKHPEQQGYKRFFIDWLEKHLRGTAKASTAVLP
jgi:alpha-L-fucosidase 2